MDKDKKYPSMYFMNNSGEGKFRELKPENYFTFVQPNEKAIGQNAFTGYKFAIMFSNKDYESLKQEVEDFTIKNKRLIDFKESNRLVEIISCSKEDMPKNLVNNKAYAEITDKVKQGEGLLIAKAMRTTYTGPDKSKWYLYLNKPDKTIYGKNNNATHLSYLWWS
ncbi:MAG: hypothetical protein ACQESF_06565 [Nanobdellota archaeon]